MCPELTGDAELKMDWTKPPTKLDAMGFYSGCLAFGDDQIAGVRHERLIGGSRDEEQMDWLFQYLAFANVNERTISGKRRVERGKRITLSVDITAEVRFKRGRIGLDLVRETVDANSGGQSAERGQFAAEVSVDKDELTGRAGQKPSFELEARVVPKPWFPRSCLGF